MRTPQRPLQLLKDPALMQIVDPSRIRLHRVAKRYSLRRVAEMCGNCSHEAVRNWESGRTPTIPEATAVRLSQILEFPMSSVFRSVDGFALPEVSTSPHTDHHPVAS